jgi:hypothetical protein
MGGFFAAWVLFFFFFKNLLIEDRAEGQVFFLKFIQGKGKKFLEVIVTISVRCSNIPRDHFHFNSCYRIILNQVF